MDSYTGTGRLRNHTSISNQFWYFESLWVLQNIFYKYKRQLKCIDRQQIRIRAAQYRFGHFLIVETFPVLAHTTGGAKLRSDLKVFVSQLQINFEVCKIWTNVPHCPRNAWFPLSWMANGRGAMLHVFARRRLCTQSSSWKFYRNFQLPEIWPQLTANTQDIRPLVGRTSCNCRNVMHVLSVILSKL